MHYQLEIKHSKQPPPGILVFWCNTFLSYNHCDNSYLKMHKINNSTVVCSTSLAPCLLLSLTNIVSTCLTLCIKNFEVFFWDCLFWFNLWHALALVANPVFHDKLPSKVLGCAWLKMNVAFLRWWPACCFLSFLFQFCLQRLLGWSTSFLLILLPQELSLPHSIGIK